MPEVDLAARLEILNGVLNELTDVLDVREVFERVSNVVQRVLPHDLMGVVEISEGGDHIRLYAGAGAAQTQTPPYDVPLPESLKLLAQAWETQIIEDFRNHPLAQGSPALRAGMVDRSQRSNPLRRPTMGSGQFLFTSDGLCPECSAMEVALSISNARIPGIATIGICTA